MADNLLLQPVRRPGSMRRMWPEKATRSSWKTWEGCMWQGFAPTPWTWRLGRFLESSLSTPETLSTCNKWNFDITDSRKLRWIVNKDCSIPWYWKYWFKWFCFMWNIWWSIGKKQKYKEKIPILPWCWTLKWCCWWLFYSYSASEGLLCLNSEQEQRQCEDYKVKFTCTGHFCSGKWNNIKKICKYWISLLSSNIRSWQNCIFFSQTKMDL